MFLMFFCVLLCVGEVSAQKHDWTKVNNPGERYTSQAWYFDYSNIQRLKNGRARGWTRSGSKVTQIEVDCVAERFKVLKEIELGNSSGYGQPTPDVLVYDITDVAESLNWQVSKPGSYDYDMSVRVCIGAKDLPIQTTDSTTKKKVVRKVVRRKH
jgi:hypothetical protein